MNIVLYGTTVEKITSVLDSGILEGCNCNIVGVCTDELVLGTSAIKNIPIIQIDDVDCSVVLLDDGMPDAYRKAIDGKGLLKGDLDWILQLTKNTDLDAVSEPQLEGEEMQDAAEPLTDTQNDDVPDSASDASDQERI